MNVIIWTLVSLYVLLIVVLNISQVQSFMGNRIAAALSEKLGTEVNIENVNLGLFNRLVIDGVLIKDKQGKDMLTSDRLAVKIEILPLLEGKISISSAQVFGAHLDLYKPSADAAENFRFILDSFACFK